MVTADHFYQPLPTDRTLRAQGRRHRVPSTYAADADKAAALLAEILTEYGAEFHGPDGPAAKFGYTPARSQLGPGDQEVLFALLRHVRPNRVVEIGAGGSTLITAAALALNDNGATFTSIEPFPAAWLSEVLPSIEMSVDLSLRPTPLQDVDADLFRQLEVGDVLFVDSSHVYRPGSDVEHEFLEIYPRLADGVLLHVHDVFLPDDYPPAWNLVERRYWNEQYVLEAVLANSVRFRPLLPLAHLAQSARPTFQSALSDFGPDDDAGLGLVRDRGRTHRRLSQADASGRRAVNSSQARSRRSSPSSTNGWVRSTQMRRKGLGSPPAIWTWPGATCTPWRSATWV